MPLAGAAPAAPTGASAGSAGTRKKRPRPPPDVQELLDALLHLQGHYAAASAAARAQAKAQGQAKDAAAAAHAKERAALLAWFAALPLAERRRVLFLDEPAFLMLVGLMARCARARAERQYAQERWHADRASRAGFLDAARTRARFVVFPEGVPALAPPAAVAAAAVAGASAASGGRAGRGGRKEAEAALASMAGPGRVDVGLLGDEPFSLRPDTSCRRTAWGDALAPLAEDGAARAWGRLFEGLLVLPPVEVPTAAVFATALLADAPALVRTLEAASGGGFLREPVAAEECQAMWGEAPWFRAKGEYSIGELLANKAELLLWRAWRVHQHQQQAQQQALAAKPRQQQQPKVQAQPPAVPAALAAHEEAKVALSTFLFQELGGRLAERRAALVGGFAKAAAAIVPAHATPDAEGLLEGVTLVLGMLDRYRLLLLPAAPAEAREGALERLLATRLSGSTLETAVLGRWVAELKERRTAWHQRELLALLEDEGARGAGAGAAGLSGQQVQQGPSKAARKKMKKRRQQQQLQQQLQQRQLEEEGERAKPQQLLEAVSEAGEAQGEEESISAVVVGGGGDGGTAAAAVAAGAGAGKEQEEPGVTRQDCATQTEEEDGKQGPSEEDGEEAANEEDEDEEEQEEEAVRSGSRSGAEAEAEAEASADYWEGEDTVVADQDTSNFSTALAPAAPGAEEGEEGEGEGEGGAPLGPVLSTETLLRDLCLKLEAEVATLRGVLATQRGLVVAAQQRPPSAAAAPAPAAYPGPYAHTAAATTLHQGGAGGGFGGGVGRYSPHAHASGAHSLSHHLEIMSDDGRGGRGGGGGGGMGWGGMQRAHTHSSFAHPSHLAPPPPQAMAEAVAAAATTTGSVYSAEGVMGAGSGGGGGGNGGGYGHSPQPPHRAQAVAAAAAAGAPVASLPRNPSGPLPAQAQGWAAASAARLPRPALLPSSSQQPQHPPPQQAATDEGGFPAAAAPCPVADGCSGFVLERRRPQPPLRSRLCDDIAAFVGMVGQLTTGAALAEQSLAVTRCRQVVQSLWPRAQVKTYGSVVTGLALPSSDVDLVICLPKVRKDAPAEAPGALEGRNAIKETWQQELARRLRATPWVHPGSIRIIPHTAIPVIKLRALSARLGGGGAGSGGAGGGGAAPAVGAMGGERLPSPAPVSGGGGGEGPAPGVVDVGQGEAAAAAQAAAEERGVQLDVSIEGAQHNGLLANRVIADLLRESPALRPLVLVLKQFLKERGLMESYSGGLSSYGLVLMAARYLQEQSGVGPMDTGSLLLGFLDFYSNHFDPRTTGISVSRRCFFSRDQGGLSGPMAAATPHHPHHPASAAAAASAVAQHRRGSLGGDGGPELAYYERARQHSLVGMSGGGPGTGLGGATPLLLPENPYRFDPLYIEDPIAPGSNVGRNCFRVFQIQRAWNDAWRALDPAAAASAGFRHWRQPPAPAPAPAEGDGDGQGGGGVGVAAAAARRPHPSSLPLLGRVLCSL